MTKTGAEREIMGFYQRAVDLGYDSSEDLVRKGVWGGELYQGERGGGEFVRGSRAWLWRHLDDSDADGVDLVCLPGETPGEQQENVPKSRTGIRRLTPSTASAHPLVSSAVAKKLSAEQLRESLEVVDLDLKRLLIHPMFTDEPVHVKNLKLLLYNYLVKNNVEYKQGFHEILGMIYLQIYDSDEDQQDKLKVILKVFTKLMNPLNSVFYEEENLLKWESKVFRPMLLGLSPKIFSIIYSGHGKNHNNNLIWIIRWTRLLFIREIAQKTDILELWDHLLTLTSSQFSLFIASFISVLLISVYDQIIAFSKETSLDHDDLIEVLLLRYKEMNPNIDVVRYCQTAMEAADVFNANENDRLYNICKRFLAWKYGETNEILNLHQSTRNMVITGFDTPTDIHRLRMEEKLKRRVLGRLKK